MKGNDKEIDHFTSIILLTDFSDNAKNAIRFAIDAFGTTTSYSLVNAYYVRTSSGTFLDLNNIVAKESEEGLKKEEEWIKSEFKELDLTIETHSIFGSPIDALHQLVNDKDHDIVIMGTKGASGIDGVLFGSVASSVITNTVVPVISIPPEYKFNGFKNAVFASDGMKINDTKVLNPILMIHEEFETDLTVLSVQNPTNPVDLTDLYIKNAKNITIEGADVVESVLQYCSNNETDLLILLPKHTGFFSRLFHRSISKQIVQKAELPILSLEND